MNYSFTNAVASLKEGAQPLDETRLRVTKVFGKLMLPKGSKVTDIQTPDNFLTNEAGTFIRAELFVIGKQNQIITDSRVYLNVDINSDIRFNELTKSYYVELQHPTIDITNDSVVFKAK